MLSGISQGSENIQTDTLQKYANIVLKKYAYKKSKTDSIYNSEGELIDNKIKKIKNYVISDSLLNKNIKTAFNNVVFSSSNIVSNASAFGYSQNEEKSNVSANVNFHVNKKRKTNLQFVKVGLNTESNNGVLGIYDRQSWSNTVGLNLGYIYKFKGGQYISKKSKEQWKTINKKRKYFLYESIRSHDKTEARRDSIKKFLTQIENHIDNNTDITAKEVIDLQKKKKNLVEIYNKLSAEKKVLDKNYKNTLLSNSCDTCSNQIHQFYYEKAFEFDKKNDITKGYNFSWIDFTTSINNQSYKFDEDNFSSTSPPKFNDSIILKNNYNRLRVGFGLNFNKIKNKEKHLLYWSLGIQYNTGSILNNPLFYGDVVIKDSTNLILVDDYEKSYGSLLELEKKVIHLISFKGNCVHFFGKKKTIGINLVGSYGYPLGVDIKTENQYNLNDYLTFLAGPVFRTIKDDKTSATFGIDLGFENMGIYKGSTWGDYFTARVKIGVPFNIYKSK